MPLDLPENPDITEKRWHIRGANNIVRVIIRNRYAHMGHEDLLNLRIECRWDTGPESCEWRTVPGTVTRLMKKDEAYRRAAVIYHGDWVGIIERAGGDYAHYLVAANRAQEASHPDRMSLLMEG